MRRLLFAPWMEVLIVANAFFLASACGAVGRMLVDVLVHTQSGISLGDAVSSAIREERMAAYRGERFADRGPIVTEFDQERATVDDPDRVCPFIYFREQN